MQSLKTMSPHEKANFLSMDFIERMIRVEQSVSASFHKPIFAKQTLYYKNLSPQVKIAFDNYERRKRQNKTFLCFLFFSSLLIVLFFNVNLTGNVIAENMSSTIYQRFNVISIFVLVITVIISMFLILSNRKSEKRFVDKSKIIEDFIIKKQVTKK